MRRSESDIMSNVAMTRGEPLVLVSSSNMIYTPRNGNCVVTKTLIEPGKQGDINGGFNAMRPVL